MTDTMGQGARSQVDLRKTYKKITLHLLPFCLSATCSTISTG